MNPKERHYWTQLRAALTAGQWSSASPSKTPNGHPLSWSELLRKFNKHCKGFQDFAEVAAHTRALANLLSEIRPDDDESGESADDERLTADTGGSGSLGVEREVVLGGAYLEQASSRFDALKALESPNFSVRSTQFFLSFLHSGQSK